MAEKKKPSKLEKPLDLAQPTFRSGAVARMAGMPVSTLRIWEQRYQVVAPITAASGHRLYSAADAERIALVRQLTERGHAIGSLAGLDMEQLRNVAVTHATAASQVSVDRLKRRAQMKIIVVGQAMAQRLKQPALSRRWARPPHVVGVFDSLAEAAQAATGSGGAEIDLLLWQSFGLQTGTLTDLKAAQDAWSARDVAVAYRFSNAAARNELVSTGASVIREPADDDALGIWLSSLEAAFVGRNDKRSNAAGSMGIDPWSLGVMGLLDLAAPARRFDDATLTEFVGLSSSIVCECPRHVTELLLQICNFETYSADCTNRSPADAVLHAHLQQVAGAARILFETAMERIAVAEGWPLP